MKKIFGQTGVASHDVLVRRGGVLKPMPESPGTTPVQSTPAKSGRGSLTASPHNRPPQTILAARSNNLKTPPARYRPQRLSDYVGAVTEIHITTPWAARVSLLTKLRCRNDGRISIVVIPRQSTYCYAGVDATSSPCTRRIFRRSSVIC